MRYPNIILNDTHVTKTGKKLTRLLRNFYPGNFSATSNIVLQWGQRTDLPRTQNTVIFDHGYFRREYSEYGNRHYRLSINEYHPTHLPPAPADRWEMLGLELENFYNPDGPVILVGRGRKTRVKQRSNGADWELATLEKIRRAFPKKQIIYRPKSMRRVVSNEVLPGAISDPRSSIPELCQGASLVVTQQSNIGNEAILYGIPVVSEGGPASDICPSKIQRNQKPLSDDQRIDFLSRLAYWQWSIDEIKNGDIWPWLFEQIKLRSNLKPA